MGCPPLFPIAFPWPLAPDSAANWRLFGSESKIEPQCWERSSADPSPMEAWQGPPGSFQIRDPRTLGPQNPGCQKDSKHEFWWQNASLLGTVPTGLPVGQGWVGPPEARLKRRQ